MKGSDPATLIAPRYGLLVAETNCYRCRATMPAAALWVADYTEYEDGENLGGDDAAVLQYIEWLDNTSEAFVRTHAAWLQPAFTKTSGMSYWANCCGSCSAAQGDHFLFSPDGPFWPQDDKALAALRFVPGSGSIRACASAARSLWMEQVERICRR